MVFSTISNSISLSIENNFFCLLLKGIIIVMIIYPYSNAYKLINPLEREYKLFSNIKFSDNHK